MVLISNPISQRPRTVSAKTVRKSASESFEIKEEQAIQAPQPTNSIQVIQSVFMNYDHGNDKTQLAQYGNEILDVLEDVKRGIIVGALDMDTLQKLSQQIEDRYHAIQDPNLQELMREIETRAKVELAKRGLIPPSVDA